MDEAVNRRARAGAVALLLACAAKLAGVAHAQGLPDPTRPQLGAPSGAPAAGAASGAPQLQSVLIGRAPGGRRLAVIDGETVRVGDTVRGARVARVTDTEVELVRGSERQRLHLYAQDDAGAANAGASAPVARR